MSHIIYLMGYMKLLYRLNELSQLIYDVTQIDDSSAGF